MSFLETANSKIFSKYLWTFYKQKFAYISPYMKQTFFDQFFIENWDDPKQESQTEFEKFNMQRESHNMIAWKGVHTCI